jgi:hypothetical protein
VGQYEALEALADLASKDLEAQVATAEVIRQKTESAIGLGTAALGGGYALVGLAVEKIPAALGWPLLVLVVVAGTLNLLALLFFVRSTLAIRTSLIVGPSPDWVREKSKDATWTKNDLWASLLSKFPEKSRANDEVMKRAVDRRIAGMRLLILAMAFHALTFVYVLGVGIAHPPSAG